MRGMKKVIHTRWNPNNLKRPQGARFLCAIVWNSLPSSGPKDSCPSQRCGRRGSLTGRPGSSHCSIHGIGGQGGWWCCVTGDVIAGTITATTSMIVQHQKRGALQWMIVEAVLDAASDLTIGLTALPQVAIMLKKTVLSRQNVTFMRTKCWIWYNKHCICYQWQSWWTFQWDC